MEPQPVANLESDQARVSEADARASAQAMQEDGAHQEEIKSQDSSKQEEQKEPHLGA